MALTILHHPDTRLRTKAEPVSEFTPRLAHLANDMLETMYHQHGIGLAGTQVNFHKRIIVVDVSEQGNRPIILVNPDITILPDATIEPFEEGCLSVPEFRDTVNRPNHISVTYQNVQGTQHTMKARGLLAICIQHECDHLEGRLFIDYLSQLKRQRISNKLKKRKLENS